MTEAQEIARNLKFLDDVRKLVQRRVKCPENAHGAVCSLTLAAVQLAFFISERDPVQTRDMMVSALNLGLKHGIESK